jgi:hypothetical protein
MKIIECAQLSPEWWEARKGIPTASNFDRIMTPKKMVLSSQCEPYIAELIAEQICLNPNYFTEQGRPITQAMTDGVDNEPEARRFYEIERDVTVQQVGFVTTDDSRFGCSPDGLVGEDGGLELKCPMLKTQVMYVLNGQVPDEYLAQVHGSLIVTGRKWWDFLSYCPGAPPLLIRVTPNAFTEKLRACLEQFWTLYQESLAKFIKGVSVQVQK